MKIKKMLSLILILILTLSSFSTTIVFAEDEFGQTADGWKYEKSGDGYAWIINYVGNEEKVTIPQVVDGRKVVVVEIVNTNLKEIIVPDNAEFHWFTFNDCTGLEKVYVGNGTKEIVERAFKGCTSLEKVELPDTLKVIKTGAFADCASLKEINIPNSVTQIHNSAFSRTALTSVTFPENATVFGDYMFYKCKKLEEVIFLSDTIDYIENPEYDWEIFKNTFPNTFFLHCESLKSVNIPEGVESIDNNAFSGCKSLESIIIPEGVNSIGEAAFSSCKSLESITIPKSVNSIGPHAFSGCTSFRKLELPDTLKVIATGAFSGCTSLEEVTIQNGMSSIGNDVFHDCTSLKTVNLPDTLETIGFRTFYGCSSLKSIDIPESVTLIEVGAFQRSGLESIVIPENCKTFGDSVFSYCKNLKEISILSDTINYLEFDSWHDGIWEPMHLFENTIPSGFFASCAELKSFDIPETVTYIQTGAFYDSGIETITIPENCVDFGNGVFSNCENLKEINFESKNINYYTNYHDYEDGRIKGKNENQIPKGFVKGCTSLKSIKIPESVKSIGEGAFQNSGLTSITIPKNVKTVYKDAFKGCENLTSVKFSGKVNNIGRSAFSKCVNLKTVNFTKGYLKKVYNYAFYKCEKLDKITISNTKNVPTIAKSAFNKAKSGIKFFVKNNTVAKKLKTKLQKTNIKKAKIYRSAPILLYKNVG